MSRSISPQMQRAGFRAAGLSLDYTCVRVRADELARAFPGLLRRFVGLNVTRPLKAAVLPLLDAVSKPAAEAGSVNTVVLSEGTASGDSTDGTGFLAALSRQADEPVRRAVVLGTGGAARAVAAALRGHGAAVQVAGRNPAAAARLGADLGAEPVAGDLPSVTAAVEGADLLVNATPVGAEPCPASSPLLEALPLRPGLTVFDLVYLPRVTALLRRAEAAGCRTVQGVEMLIEQGVRSFELWTHCRAPVAAMRAAAYAALPEEAA